MGGMAIYTAPIKALSNQKFRDFHARYKDAVGILTGDVSIHPHAPILIMTTEIYRNALMEGDDRFARCRWVIFDEVHYLDDPERGTVWEEALLLTPRHTEILALSATIPNAHQIASWIERIHGRPVRVIQETHRVVPLRFAFQCQNELFWDWGRLKAEGYRGCDRSGFQRSHAFRMGRYRRSHRFHFPSKRRAIQLRIPPESAFLHTKPNRADHLMRQIRQAGHLPCLWFVFSRLRAEELAEEFARQVHLPDTLQRQLLDRFDALCQRYGIAHEPSAMAMRDLVRQAVAYHHAGLLPTLKEIVEVLFASRLIEVIVTTETFALGINMPARSVVLDTLTRKTKWGRTLIRVRELAQMAGRAGRRGMDDVGFVYLRIRPWEVSFSELTRLVTGKPEDVSSRFSLTYAAILNLYRHHGSDLLAFYQKTLHAFQSSASGRRQALALIDRRLTLLKQLDYIQPPHLTHKGEFASSLYGYELILTEGFDQGLLDRLSMTDLGILLLAIICEPRPGTPPKRLSPHLAEWVEEVHRILKAIHKKEQALQISPLTKPPAFHLWEAMERWIAGASFAKVVDIAKIDEGELIRFFRMTVQLCRTLSGSKAATPTLKAKSSELLKRINRDEVDAEAELRRSL